MIHLRHRVHQRHVACASTAPHLDFANLARREREQVASPPPGWWRGKVTGIIKLTNVTHHIQRNPRHIT
eukprot:9283964-Pyramimonas_sp.AAC.1